MEDDETSLDLYEDLDKLFCSTRSVPECSSSPRLGTACRMLR